jgi:hypothetical protein
MDDCPAVPYLGVGVLTDTMHDVAALAVATEITTSVVRHLAQQRGEPGVADLAPYLPHARQYTQALTAKQTLWLAVLPARGALGLPDDHLALFTLVTRYWKTWQSHVIQASDQIVAEFLRRTERTPDQVRVTGVPHVRGRRYFVYQVFVTAPSPAMVPAVGETA